MAGRLIEFGAQHLVAAAADDQELVAGEVGINGHDVVTERLVEARGRRGRLHGDLLVQVDVFGCHFSQMIDIHSVDESLYVHVEYLRRLRLGADVGQPHTVAASYHRQ